MESPLSAREFLKRFHLPQLVRISSPAAAATANHPNSSAGEDDTNRLSLDLIRELKQKQQREPPSVRRPPSPAGRSNTSVSSSFVAVGKCCGREQPHEASNWTYSGATTRREDDAARAVNRSSVSDVSESVASDEHQSADEFERAEVEEDPDQDQDEHDELSLRFRSISAWSSVQVDRLLENEREVRQVMKRSQRQAIQVPRASLAAPASASATDVSGAYYRQYSKQTAAVTTTGKSRKNVEFETRVGGSGASVVQSSVEVNGGAEDHIRLTPPSKRPTLSKLQLSQPFLLYKAYRKLELCAYLIDPKNELTEKSGDRIYFPQNYPGWFSLSGAAANSNTRNLARPLATIDEVCRTSAQIFLTRDELIGYELPSKLSHLTKLKNNQLLALPLAINLESKKKDKQQQQEQHEDGQSISDIKRVVIRCGQVLKICGIYEDVLPLIKGKQNQSQAQRKQRTILKQQQQASPSDKVVHKQTYRMYDDHPPNSISQHKMAPSASGPVLSPSQRQQFYQQLPLAGYQRDTSKAEMPRYGTGENRHAGSYSSSIGAYQGRQQQQHHYKSPAVLANKAHLAPPGFGHQIPLDAIKQAQPLPKRPAGQRYARCILLSSRSIDHLTDFPLDRLSQTELDAEKLNETEVLIPMDQRGRFYLCATNKSIQNEPHFYLSTAHTHPTNLVLKLSQIVYLLGLSRKFRLASQAGHNQQQANSNCDQRPRSMMVISNATIQGQQYQACSGLKLPLSVHLILGPRPATFSPTMLGTSSTMESYFRLESNIAGHRMACSFNQNFASQQQTGKPALRQMANTTSNGPVCGCFQAPSGEHSSANNRYELFSAALRFERVAKRDVLLACTIKKDPLIHLDLFNEHHQGVASALSSSSSSGATCSQHKSKTADSKHLQQTATSRLRDLEHLKCDNNFKNTAASKSSFSRLRACRSLISLNGRRKKQRPNIPSCMLTPIAYPAAGKNVSASAGAFDGEPPDGATAGCVDASMVSQVRAADAGGGEQTPMIVMIEFDCNDEALSFVRTFIESSIPTSSIPDLVLNRMEFCHNNSLEWERQLKLSYKSLSVDFDSCQQQLEQNQRRRLQPPPPVAIYSHPNLARHPTLSECEPEVPSGYLNNNNSEVQQRSNQFISSLSTASSRSSSGVSSAGERGKRESRANSSGDGSARSQELMSAGRTSFQAQASATNYLHHGSSISEPPGNGATLSSGSAASSISASVSLPVARPTSVYNVDMASKQPTSRLLRLVHRILPQPPATSKLDTHLSGGRRELPPHPKAKEQRAVTTSGGKLDDDSQGTLMDAQKVHRRLMASAAQVAAEPWERRLAAGGNNNTKEQQLAAAAATSGGDSSSSNSHLYESLEQLNEARAREAKQQQQVQKCKMYKLQRCNNGGKEKLARIASGGGGGDNRAASWQQQHEHGRAGGGGRRLPFGRSIENLIGGRLRVVSRSWQASARASATGGDRVASATSDNGDDDDCDQDKTTDSDEYDAWWPTACGYAAGSGGGDDDESTGERVCVSLGADLQQQRHRQAMASGNGGGGWRRLADASGRHGEKLARQRRARRRQLFDVGAMEPVSIEHDDEFVSMVCRDDEKQESSGGTSSGDSTLDDNKSDRAADRDSQAASCTGVGRDSFDLGQISLECVGEIEARTDGRRRSVDDATAANEPLVSSRLGRQSDQVVYANLDQLGQHLLQAPPLSSASTSCCSVATSASDDELIGGQSSRDKATPTVGRMERKLARMRARRQHEAKGGDRRGSLVQLGGEWRSERQLSREPTRAEAGRRPARAGQVRGTSMSWTWMQRDALAESYEDDEPVAAVCYSWSSSLGDDGDKFTRHNSRRPALGGLGAGDGCARVTNTRHGSSSLAGNKNKSTATSNYQQAAVASQKTTERGDDGVNSGGASQPPSCATTDDGGTSCSSGSSRGSSSVSPASMGAATLDWPAARDEHRPTQRRRVRQLA